MKIQLLDVLSLSGRDYVVEGLISYSLTGKTHLLARAVDGAEVIWIEPSANEVRRDATEGHLGRPLVLREIRDLDLSAPPPESISYHGIPYVLRLAGRATLEVRGTVPERVTGSAQLWRYRSAGDLVLQIEEQDGRLSMLAGAATHGGMIDLLPAR